MEFIFNLEEEREREREREAQTRHWDIERGIDRQTQTDNHACNDISSLNIDKDWRDPLLHEEKMRGIVTLEEDA